ncbi:hypothetical protein K438DRAFT_1975655 [Mycena galopus ATCC 62051]|nr:hypothetical protein K438DRAFT_1975655 [Mycena galopus ATCC 62051]
MKPSSASYRTRGNAIAVGPCNDLRARMQTSACGHIRAGRVARHVSLSSSLSGVERTFSDQRHSLPLPFTFFGVHLCFGCSTSTQTSPCHKCCTHQCGLPTHLHGLRLHVAGDPRLRTMSSLDPPPQQSSRIAYPPRSGSNPNTPVLTGSRARAPPPCGENAFPQFWARAGVAGERSEAGEYFALVLAGVWRPALLLLVPIAVDLVGTSARVHLCARTRGILAWRSVRGRSTWCGPDVVKGMWEGWAMAVAGCAWTDTHAGIDVHGFVCGKTMWRWPARISLRMDACGDVRVGRFVRGCACGEGSTVMSVREAARVDRPARCVYTEVQRMAIACSVHPPTTPSALFFYFPSMSLCLAAPPGIGHARLGGNADGGREHPLVFLVSTGTNVSLRINASATKAIVADFHARKRDSWPVESPWRFRTRASATSYINAAQAHARAGYQSGAVL